MRSQRNRLMTAGALLAILTMPALAVRPFACAIRENGGDYATLKAFLNAMKADYTLALGAANGVFTCACSGDGAFADGATLAWTGGGGTLLHQTTAAKSGSDAVLVRLTAGDVPAVGDTISQGGQQIVTTSAADTAAIIGRIEGAWTNPDTQAAVAGTGWNNDAAHALTIYTVGAARHKGKWTPTAYRMVVTDATCLTLSIPWFTLDGAQFRVAKSATGSDTGVTGVFCGATGCGRVGNCIITGDTASFTKITKSGQAARGVQMNVVGGVAQWWNLIVYGFRNTGGGTGTIGRGIDSGNGVSAIFNCTVSDCDQGINSADTNINCAVFNNASDFSGCGNISFCASDDGRGASPVDWNNEAEGWANVFVNYDTSDYTAADFRLKKFTGAGKIIGMGTDDPGAGLYADDIAGTARTSPWDIGAFEYLPPPPGATLIRIR